MECITKHTYCKSNNIIGKGKSGTIYNMTCNKKEYAVKMVTTKKEIEIQQLASEHNISMHLYDVIECDEHTYGMVMELLDSTLEQDLLLSKNRLYEIIPYCTSFLTNLIHYTKPFLHCTSFNHILDKWIHYQDTVKTYQSIDQFYSMFFTIKLDQYFLQCIKNDIEQSLSGTIMLPEQKRFDTMNETMTYLEPYWSLRSTETIYEKIIDTEDIEESDIDMLRNIKIDLSNPIFSSITLPIVPYVEEYKLLINPTKIEQHNIITIMIKCMIAIKKLNSLGIVHNDIHSKNIMRNGSIYYLIDFGSAFFSNTIKDDQYDIEDLLHIFYHKPTDYPLIFENEYIKSNFELLQDLTVSQLEKKLGLYKKSKRKRVLSVKNK
jgi:tRNA A-37 threonylcarbamoyl transferase component Bud32